MYHVRLKWLTWFQLGQALFFASLITLFTLRKTILPELTIVDTLGIEKVAIYACAAHLTYTICIYPFIRERQIWWSHVFGIVIVLFPLEFILEKSGGYTSWVWIPWFLTAFFSTMIGPIVGLTILSVNIIFMGLVFAGTLRDNHPFLGLVVVGIEAILILLGWLIFRRHYVQGSHESTQIERLDSMLKEEQLKSEILIESIADGVVVVDKQNTIQLLNPAACAMVGWRAEESLGLDCRSILTLFDEHDKNITDTENPFLTVLSEGKQYSDSKIRLATRSGKKIYISLTVSPITRPQTGERVGAIGIFRDVSEEREQERQRADFISTASHEMRTPVAAIEGFLALALNPAVAKVDPKGTEYLSKAHAATKHLGQLFQDLLTISKAEDGRLENHPQVVEVGELLRELSEQWGFAVAKKNLKLEYSAGESVVNKSQNRVIVPVYYVNVDPERLREVLTNIFDNAVKYTTKGKITVRLDADHDNVMVSIEDTGAGIAREDIPHLFQKFYRVDNSATRQVGGTGLGLFLCRKILDLYHGSVAVDSELGKGSRFTISIPRLDTSKATEMQHQANPAGPQPPTQASPAPAPPPQQPVVGKT